MNPKPSREFSANSARDFEQIPEPAEGGPGHRVVQVNVEEDLIVGGMTEPANGIQTVETHPTTLLLVSLIISTILGAIVLVAIAAFAIVWLSGLVGVVGELVWLFALVVVLGLFVLGYFGVRVVQNSGVWAR